MNLVLKIKKKKKKINKASKEDLAIKVVFVSIKMFSNIIENFFFKNCVANVWRVLLYSLN